MSRVPPKLTDLFLQPPRTAFCERLICLHRPGQPSDWWRELQDDAQDLFWPQGRLREAPLARSGDKTQQAVAAGCHPVLFLSYASDWPAVYDALGRYRKFAQLCIQGRDDRLMRHLLHHPSLEIQEVYAGEGRILVPDMEYGKALDRELEANLTDFEPADRRALKPAENELRPRFQFVSRLNPYRRLNLQLYRDKGQAELKQFYGAEGGQEEPCDLDIPFLKTPLKFPLGSCRLTPAQADLIAAMIQWFELPIADWSEPETKAPWRLVEKLTEMARGGRAYLTRAQQAVLFALAQTEDAIRQLQMSVAESLIPPGRAAVRTRGGWSPVASFVLVTGLKVKEGGVQLSLSWDRKQPPAKRPQLSVFVNDRKIAFTDLDVDWPEPWTSLTLRGLSVQEPELAWRWDAGEKLQLFFITKPADLVSRMTTNPMSPHKTFFRRLVTGKVCSAELPSTLALADINGALADLHQRCFDGPGEEKVEWGGCIVLRDDRLHMPERHRTQGSVHGVAPTCYPTSSDPEHREEYVGFAHTHPWVDGEPYPGFSASDFRASLLEGECLALVCNGPELFALVRTADCTRPQQAVSDEEFKRWQSVYDKLIDMEGWRPKEASLWYCLWKANRIMCEITGYALYYSDSWREAGSLDLLFRPSFGEMAA